MKGAAEAPVGEHSLDPVGRLTNVFEHQDRAAQIGQVGGAEQVGGHGEVGRQQRACGHSTTPALALEIGQGLAEQQGPQPLLAPARLGGQGGQQRPVDGPALPLGQLGPEQGGDVGEAQQPAGLQV